MDTLTIFGIGVFVTLLCLAFVVVTAIEMRRLQRRAPSDDGISLASK